MNDQQEYVLANLRDELDAKNANLGHLRNQVEGLRLRVEILKDDRDRWVNICRIKFQTIAMTYVASSIAIPIAIGIAIGWWFL